jgi:hypothetical protein
MRQSPPDGEPSTLTVDEFSAAYADVRAMLGLPPRWDL